MLQNAYGVIPSTGAPRKYYGCFLGGNGNLLAAQLIDVLFIGGEHGNHGIEAVETWSAKLCTDKLFSLSVTW